ncbi:MAG: Lpg1974 family pore-forming outer membrane protein [Legionella sp.]
MCVLKKTALTILFLGSSSLFAGAMGPSCTPGNVTVPCAHEAWDVGVQGLYLQTAFNKDFSFYPTGANGIYKDLTGHWDWAFQLETAYYFNTGNDLAITWYHLHAKNRHFGLNLLGLFNPINLQLDLNNQWDALQVEFGQYANFSEASKIRFHGGIQYSRITSNVNAVIGYADDSFSFAPEGLVNPVSLTAFNTEYNGFGPRIGLDLFYVLGDGFSIYGKTATSLLVGRAKFKDKGLTPVVLDDMEVEPVLIPISASGSRAMIVPEMEAKIGGNYTYLWSHGDIIIDVGYVWFNYFNTLSNQNILSNIQINQELNRKTESTDFGVSGPYFGLKYVGNI